VTQGIGTLKAATADTAYRSRRCQISAAPAAPGPQPHAHDTAARALASRATRVPTYPSRNTHDTPLRLHRSHGTLIRDSRSKVWRRRAKSGCASVQPCILPTHSRTPITRMITHQSRSVSLPARDSGQSRPRSRCVPRRTASLSLAAWGPSSTRKMLPPALPPPNRRARYPFRHPAYAYPVRRPSATHDPIYIDANALLLSTKRALRTAAPLSARRRHRL